MNIKNYKKLFWQGTFFVIISVFLFTGMPGVIKENSDVFAAGQQKKWGNQIIAKILMATCSNQYTSSACTNCNMGQHDDISVINKFGGGTSLERFLCAGPGLIPHGKEGAFNVGSIMMAQSNIQAQTQNMNGGGANFQTYKPSAVATISSKISRICKKIFTNL